MPTAQDPPYTIIGTPFSTFTRTITLGLQHKGLPFKQLATKPQAPLAKENHPFGNLPTLIIHEIDGKKVDLKLRESHAIVRYIDRIAPEPSLHLREGDAIIPEKMWEFVSFVAFFGFPIVEGLVIKPRLKALDEGKISDAEVREQIKDGVEEARHFLTLAESLMAPEGYWEIVSPRLVAWTEKMDKLDAVKATTAGTLSVGARP
ncbi:hypothetical protein CPB84DRAFT_1765335 [Gymnopilus junonius]|uniref:GST N-terminal domain-containing protein n=1 Tax=Gymnopilus junonius TaxID=109634 RepID=A0A9P5NX38_GYMJU|nr:hypothetical protein CPB84DRAFT_1765335 [Gymnopilus junonius]